MPTLKQIKAEAKRLTVENVARIAGDVVQLRLEIQKLDNARKRKKADADKYYSEKSARPVADLKYKFALVKAWAGLNKSRFRDPRSWPFARAVIGWRIGNPEVKPRAKSTFAQVVAGLKRRAWAYRYLRFQEPELDKEVILNERETLTDTQLEQMGIRIVQRDNFYIDPPKEKAEQPQKDSAAA